jgi:hypothetical protein
LELLKALIEGERVGGVQNFFYALLGPGELMICKESNERREKTFFFSMREREGRGRKKEEGRREKGEGRREKEVERFCALLNFTLPSSRKKNRIT